MDDKTLSVFTRFADIVLNRISDTALLHLDYNDKKKFIETYKTIEHFYCRDGKDEKIYNMFKDLWEYYQNQQHDFAVSDRLSQTHREIQQNNREILNKLGSAIHSIKESILVGSGKFEYKEKKKKGGRNNYSSDSD